MESKESTQESIILNHGFERLITDGVRAFTVENLAGCLFMSKKTIYKFFPTKEALIDKIVSFRISQIEAEIKTVMESDSNPIQQFLGVMNIFYNSTAKLKIEQIGELKNRYPKMWKRIEDFRLNRRQDFYSILSNAQEQGLVRKSLDIQLIATIYTNIINSTFQPEFFIENSLLPKEVLPAFVEMVSGGLLSDDGQKYYKQIKGSTP
ncbi:MAG: TetR/AcrR family transcriptional regulator [Candidatus Marinimicrobia bacterium]|nr:TetR/AcrR family transcriptional regulator [Candidatus Neomarinimicrobiota bacterium]